MSNGKVNPHYIPPASKKIKTDFYSPDTVDCIRVALALETLAYHDKSYLSSKFQDNTKISEEIQALLIKALGEG